MTLETRAPEADLPDPAADLLFAREVAALRTAAYARLVLIAAMAPLVWGLSFSEFDRRATSGLIGVYLVAIGLSLWLLRRRRGVRSVGLTMVGLDVVLVVALPLIWYASLGGAELPFGFTLKTSSIVISILLITLNALALRPLYPALVTVAALGWHLVLITLAATDGQTVFTMSYLAGYSSGAVPTGRVVADLFALTLVGAFLTVLAASARRMVIEGTRLERANTQLGRYFSPNLVARLAHSPELFEVGGSRRELSFVFTDLAGFTAMVERGEPDVVMPLINAYLDALVQVAFRHEGTVDKIVGDAVHVIFGAPAEQPDHAARAVACALEMDAVGERFRTGEGAAAGFGVTRIGVNSGWAMVGNFGGEALFDYTAHGDAINTAARLESANRHLGTRICVSEETVARIPDFLGRPVGLLRLAGRSVAIDAFEPLDASRAAALDLAAYGAAFDLLRADSPEARERFAELHAACPDDPLVTLHLRRLEAGERGVELALGGK